VPKPKLLSTSVHFKKSFENGVMLGAMTAEEKRCFQVFARNLCAALTAHRNARNFPDGNRQLCAEGSRPDLVRSGRGT